MHRKNERSNHQKRHEKNEMMTHCENLSHFFKMNLKPSREKICQEKL